MRRPANDHTAQFGEHLGDLSGREANVVRLDRLNLLNSDEGYRKQLRIPQYGAGGQRHKTRAINRARSDFR